MSCGIHQNNHPSQAEKKASGRGEGERGHPSRAKRNPRTHGGENSGISTQSTSHFEQRKRYPAEGSASHGISIHPSSCDSKCCCLFGRIHDVSPTATVCMLDFCKRRSRVLLLWTAHLTDVQETRKGATLSEPCAFYFCA